MKPLPQIQWFLKAFLLVFLSLTAFLGLLPSSTMAQTFIAKERVTVFDSHEVKVGDVIGIADVNGGPVWVAFKIEGILVILRVRRNGLSGPETTEAYYLSQDCTDQPFLRGPRAGGSAQMLPAVFIASPGKTVYAWNPDVTSTTFFPQSKLKGNGSCVKLNLRDPLKLYPAKSLVNLDEIFSPPYTIR